MSSLQKTYESFNHVMLLFAFLGVIFIPFSFRTWSFQAHLTQFLFEDLILFIAHFFENIHIANPTITSDSTTFYLLFLVLFLIALLVRIIVSFFTFWEKHQEQILHIIQLILVYYLAVIMLRYGFSKIFKEQFYLPEPNLLYTPLGMLDKDILFWSTMGVSRSYNLFMGLVEVIPALLLLYHKTRNLGLFLLSGVLINVVWINFSFDISVKLFSLFLLLITILLLAPSFKNIFQFFVLNKPTRLPYLSAQQIFHSKVFRYSAKVVVIIFIFVETLLPYIQSGHFNDDKAPRHALHGTYEIISIESINTQKTIENLNLKRFFIHRQSYFIFQYEDDNLEDFHLTIDTSNQQFTLIDYDGNTFALDYEYDEASNNLEVRSKDFGWVLYSKVIQWKDLPLLQPLFHWTVDEIK